jgi:hypothetical protein
MKIINKKIINIAIAVLAVSGLTGCSAPVAHPAASASQSPKAAEVFAKTWEVSQPVKSSLISDDLFKAGVCLSEPDIQASDTPYTGEGLKAYKSDQWRICNSYTSSQKDDATTVCKSKFTIYTDKVAGTNVKRTLGYEDGFWDLALLYGKGWEISVTPNDAAPGNQATISAACQPLLKKITSAVGGSVTLYGQY